MKPPRQFAPLFAFQAKLNPYIWFMALVLLMPIILIHPFSKDYHQNLESLLDVQNLFFVGIFGLWILAPEMAQRQLASSSSLPNPEFLLTLALDRRVLYRTRVTFFYLFILPAPTLMLLLALRSPDVTVTEYLDQARLACLHSVPGSMLQPDPDGNTSPLLQIPGGNVLVGEWHLWMYVTAAFLSQLSFTLLFPLKHRLVLFYVVFLGVAFAPLVITLAAVSHHYFSLSERLFFFFAGHQAIFWLTSEAVFIAGQLWCEQRFIRQQY
jgi:hypothetical protein